MIRSSDRCLSTEWYFESSSQPQLERGLDRTLLLYRCISLSKHLSLMFEAFEQLAPQAERVPALAVFASSLRPDVP